MRTSGGNSIDGQSIQVVQDLKIGQGSYEEQTLSLEQPAGSWVSSAIGTEDFQRVKSTETIEKIRKSSERGAAQQDVTSSYSSSLRDIHGLVTQGNTSVLSQKGAEPLSSRSYVTQSVQSPPNNVDDRDSQMANSTQNGRSGQSTSFQSIRVSERMFDEPVTASFSSIRVSDNMFDSPPPIAVASVTNTTSF